MEEKVVQQFEETEREKLLEFRQKGIAVTARLGEIEIQSKELEEIFANLRAEKEELISTYKELVDVNTKLWEVEDELRVIENTKVFDDKFIELARAVYYTNDERFRLKDKINSLTNSEIKEQKDYKEYK